MAACRVCSSSPRIADTVTRLLDQKGHDISIEFEVTCDHCGGSRICNQACCETSDDTSPPVIILGFKVEPVEPFDPDEKP